MIVFCDAKNRAGGIRPMSKPNVFEQVIKYISRHDFESAVFRHGGDKKITALDSWTWFGALLFGQMTGHDSLRAIERVFCHGNKRMKKLGFSTVCRSTLSDANKIRPLEILEETYKKTLERVKKTAPKKHRFKFDGDVRVLDSSTIELCLSLSPWANYRRKTAAVKLHTAIDIANDLPEIVVLTLAKRNDIPVAREHFNFKAGTTVIFDRGYWDATWLNTLNKQGVFFVTRQRRNNKFRVKISNSVDRTRGHIYDQVVYQISERARPKYEGKLRKIKYKDPITKQTLIFLTNRFDLDTQTICDLYKARWDVELFFKTLKQNLRVKKFLGNSANAVKAQIYVALIAYLLVQLIRFINNSKISIPDTMAAIGTLLLLREPLSILLGALPRVTRHPPDSQLLLPF